MIGRIDELEALYDVPTAPSLAKVASRVEGAYARWIGASRFVVLATVGPDGADASPRGDIGPVARILNPVRLAIPDWQGNNRIDTLRNIVLDGRIALMFMVTGCKNVVRVNGRANLTADPDMLASFEVRGRHPKSVISIEVNEVYSQCPKALMRSEFWTAEPPEVPTAGEMLVEASAGEHGGRDYDATYEERAKARMW